MPSLESVPFSLAKQEVIYDIHELGYSNINFWSMNFPLFNYKSRLLDGSLTEVDFHYSYEATEPYAKEYFFKEMTDRLQSHGFRHFYPTQLEDYSNLQESVPLDDLQPVEPIIEKYILKIIQLCKDNNVTLIFYRAPYIANPDELKEINYLKSLCFANDVPFIDLEEELEFDYLTDFYDYQHLSFTGAEKVTGRLIDFLPASIK